MRISLVGLVAVSVLFARDIQAQESDPSDPARSGRGWSLVNLDVDVRLIPDAGVMETIGVVTLRLDGLARSYGPTLLLNTQLTRAGLPAIAFREVKVADASAEILRELREDDRQEARVRFDEPKPRGTTIDVHFVCRSQGPVRRMIVSETAAMADWINAWLPFTLPEARTPVSLSPELFRVPGRTTLHLPVGWRGLVDGDRLTRRESSDGVVEVWRTPEGVARGFVAGPYEVVEKTVQDHRVRVYILSADNRSEAAQLAERLGIAIVALETRLGPFPVQGPYAIAEFPRLPEQSFGAVSEQTHVIVQPPNLDYAFSNIQLLAHEASHAWWGNLIGTGGPGAKWVSEGLAELGALIAIETLEGEAGLREFLDFGREGTDPYYSAAGYFALLRQGQDQPIATMGTGAGTHALANSKGVWVFHMLRVLLGDERFFGVLRDVVRDLRGRVLTADDLRARFIQTAPNQDLERFFHQWLDGTGAPILDVDWHANIEGTGLLLRLTQIQEGDPLAFDLEVDVRLADGTSALRSVAVDSASQVFEISTPGRPVAITLDPGRKVLIWRPVYGPRPVREIVGESMRAPPELLQAVVGSYSFEQFEKDVEVFERDGVLYMQPAGSAPVRLIPDHDGVFRVDAPGKMLADFDLSATPAPSFVSIEGGGRERYVAKRVPRSEPEP